MWGDNTVTWLIRHNRVLGATPIDLMLEGRTDGGPPVAGADRTRDLRMSSKREGDLEYGGHEWSEQLKSAIREASPIQSQSIRKQEIPCTSRTMRVVDDVRRT